MYHPTIIRERLALAQTQLDSTLKKSEQFSLTRHSIAKCREAVTHLDSLRNSDGLASRPFTPRELQWIRNERLLAKCDFTYYLRRYCYIKSDLDGSGERTILFPPNIPQLMAIDGWAEDEGAGIAIADAFLKVRQVGISTLVEMALGYRALFYANINGLISSSDPDKTREMAGMILYAIERLPYWLTPPDLATYQSGETLLEVPSADSAITLQHGTQRSGIARGRTPTDAHLSEMGEYQNAEEIVDASLLRAMHESPGMFLVLEGTGKGIHTWWHRTFDFALTYYPQGKSRLRPRFLAWYLGDGVWPTKNWLKKFPPPKDWQPSLTTDQHAKSASEYANSDPSYTKYLGSGWTMPKHQQWYYEFDRNEHEQKRILAKFLQEMPAKPTDAWQTDAGHPIFNAVEVEELNQRAKPPVAIYAIVGTDIPIKFKPNERNVDTSRPRLYVKSQWNRHYNESFEFLPIKWKGYLETGWEQLLYIWELPQDGHYYGVGVDTSDGIGQDRTVIEVLSKGDMRKPAVQCAEFATEWVSATGIVPWQMAIASFYSVRNSEGERKQARLAIDVTKSDAPQVEARKRGWHVGNFHQWERFDRKRRTSSNAIGWYQMSWARDYLVDFTTTHLREFKLKVNSPWLIEELRDLEKSETRQRIEAMDGAFDDRFFSLGMIHMSLHVWAHIFHNAPIALGGEALQSHLPPTFAAQNRAKSMLPVPPMLKYEEDLEIEMEGKMTPARAKAYENSLSVFDVSEFLDSWS